jgi:hypothetical protein
MGPYFRGAANPILEDARLPVGNTANQPSSRNSVGFTGLEGRDRCNSLAVANMIQKSTRDARGSRSAQGQISSPLVEARVLKYSLSIHIIKLYTLFILPRIL